MTPTSITLRGYAVTYGETAHIGNGALEQFAPGAFAEMLARPRAIDVRWESHEDSAERLASTTRGSLSFFEDAFGLAFSARVSMGWGRLRTITQKHKPMAMVSVGGLSIKASRHERLQLGTTEIVTSATITHITITENAAYRSTGVWPTHLPLDDAPGLIRQLDARWIEGRAAWDRKLDARRKLEASLRPIGKTVGGHLVMVAPDGRLFTKRAFGGVIFW